MAVIVGSFDTSAQADDAMARLKAAGFGEEDFSLISRANDAVETPRDPERRAHDTVDFTLVGGAVGAVLGGALLGPVGAVIGGTAAGTGVAALLSSRGVDKHEVEEYERRLREGRYLLAVDAGDRGAVVREAMDAAGAERIALQNS